MTILDSNIWIALLDKNDCSHTRAVKIFETLRGEIALPDYIVLEVCTVLTLKVGKKVALDFLKLAQDNQDVQILASTPQVFTSVLRHFTNSGPAKLSFVDYALVYFSRAYLVITFDKQLGRRLTKRYA